MLNFSCTLLAVYTTDQPVAKPVTVLNVPLIPPLIPDDTIMSIVVPFAGVSALMVTANAPERVITAEVVVVFI